MVKVRLPELDRDKTYVCLPIVVEAEELKKHTVIETEKQGAYRARRGSMVVSTLGTPRSVVDPNIFKKHYAKLSDMPEEIVECVHKVIEWKINQKKDVKFNPHAED